jgi:hypothetical protein
MALNTLHMVGNAEFPGDPLPRMVEWLARIRKRCTNELGFIPSPREDHFFNKKASKLTHPPYFQT